MGYESKERTVDEDGYDLIRLRVERRRAKIYRSDNLTVTDQRPSDVAN